MGSSWAVSVDSRALFEAIANAARHGVFAALLARAGLTGPTPIFEGERGFERQVSGPLETDIAEWATGGNSRDFEGWNLQIAPLTDDSWSSAARSSAA